jgi:dienelactone hydrolase
MKTTLHCFFSCAVLLASAAFAQVSTSGGARPDQSKRAQYLDHLLTTFRSDMDDKPGEVPVWEHWLRVSGELPPDFDELPANAFPPDMLRMNSGQAVTTAAQWPARKEEIAKILKQYMFGNWPPAPSKMLVVRANAMRSGAPAAPAAPLNGGYTVLNVQLLFGPSVRAVQYMEKHPGLDRDTFRVAALAVQLYIPAGAGPFPVIIEPGGPDRGNQASVQDTERLQRGYMVCHYDRRDAESMPAVYVDNECNQLEWWAWAAGRCVDYLYTRPDVDRDRIATAGHSRGGKTALLAAVMDERIKAVVDSHPGAGAGTFNLWRYLGEKFGGENLENSTRQFPYWNNPRMRFFIGRENKLPFDSHFLLGLLAPRACLMGTGEHDGVGEVWSDQQCYLAAKKVYQLLGNEHALGFYASPGVHEVTPVMRKTYLDWLDMQFGRKPFTFPEKLVYSYTFDDWKRVTGATLDVNEFPEKKLDDILLNADGKEIKTAAEWESKSEKVRSQIKRIIGDLPSYNKIQSVELRNEKTDPEQPDLKKADVSIAEGLVAHLTWPADRKGKVPVVIYLHAYLDSEGSNWHRGFGYFTRVGERLARNGFLAVEFDQFGYGQRNRDGNLGFFENHKDVSALGVMIQDVSKIIDAISLINWANKDKIMVSGYSLGGMVGLYAAALEPRIHAVASTCGFGSMRMDVHGNETEGIRRYAYLRPTIPRLGFFLGHENRIPYDFHEILGVIAPRPVFILAPKLDQDWVYDDVSACYSEAAKVFGLYQKQGNIVLNSPNDFNRFPPEYQESVISWLKTL